MLIVDGCNSDADANREDKDDDGDSDGVGQVMVYAKGRSYDLKPKITCSHHQNCQSQEISIRVFLHDVEQNQRL